MEFSGRAIAILFWLSLNSFDAAHAQPVRFEVGPTFFPQSKALQQENIVWGYLTVPEDWQHPLGTSIQMAVAVLKNMENSTNAQAVVFIQGGPGASGIQQIKLWMNHPLRKKNDIVLIDIRGTGFSIPRLCPELGEQFLEILSKNQSSAADEQQKVEAALSCKQMLISKGIYTDMYNSLSVANDLHALKSALGYKQWNVYGVSYGTYMAQVYASRFTEDITALILDSPIDEMATYYARNTSNYMGSLHKVFEACKNNEGWNEQYPDLETVFYKTIEDLQQRPITVAVDKSVVASGTFTFNADDFKVAVQQSLYNKQLVEVIPLLIYQFHTRNESVLANMVPAFSKLLRMDYGAYYCVSCCEALPSNSLTDFEKDASQFKNMQGGLAFYKSDFKVCERWNDNRRDSVAMSYDLPNLKETTFPVLVFSGEYDPITPIANGKNTAAKFKHGTSIIAYTYGHAPSFTKVGYQVVEEFINTPIHSVNLDAFSDVSKIQIAKNIEINAGISEMANSLSTFNLIFLFPLLIALVLMVAFIIAYAAGLLNKKYVLSSDKLMRVIILITSATGIVSVAGFIVTILQVSNRNAFILAFGLPEGAHYLFVLVWIFLALVLLTILYFIVKVKRLTNRSIIFSIIFSNMLFGIYILYWGVV